MLPPLQFREIWPKIPNFGEVYQTIFQNRNCQNFKKGCPPKRPSRFRKVCPSPNPGISATIRHGTPTFVSSVYALTSRPLEPEIPKRNKRETTVARHRFHLDHNMLSRSKWIFLHYSFQLSIWKWYCPRKSVRLHITGLLKLVPPPYVSNILPRIFGKLEKLVTAKRIDFRKLEKLVTENLAREAREKKIALFSCFTRENGDFWCQKRVSERLRISGKREKLVPKSSEFPENLKS